MSENSVQLHLRTPTERQETGMGHGSSQLPSAPEQESQNRFQAAMKANQLAPAVPLPGEASGVAVANPMGLFGGAGAWGTAPSVKPGLMPLLKDSLKGLQVGQDARSVRMELSDDLYPGVSVAIFEDAGAMVAEFRCSQQSSYDALAAPAQEMASQLADDISRDALWRVIDESAGPVAEGDPDHTTEAFASAPSR